ncbi:MAG: hypothetical protein A2Y82_03610 [Candidatus Buchananbacteria bacterium RBG_13_36_9]|uniref:Uncharacterized protein n=1 Tax=Candidatus Buchananbacteria bacterium RBG_13_36_9 TaxID=1797530 RepID=A0A1G1XLG2_9BACT|nr:MAG: hypothetical protein A2Y82_03610 [Candidatus Buchananbacteria bacterium RBG_13_36_9]
MPNDVRTFVIEYIARQNGIAVKNVRDDMVINPSNAFHFSMFACANFGKPVMADSTKSLSINEAIELIGADSKLLQAQKPISEKARTFVLQYAAKQNNIKVEKVKDDMLIKDMDNFYMQAIMNLGIALLSHNISEQKTVKESIEFLSQLM